jgi:hypothetical protein
VTPSTSSIPFPSKEKDPSRGNDPSGTPDLNPNDRTNQNTPPSSHNDFNQDDRPPQTLDQIIASELNKSGLSGIDDNLLKVLLIRNLMSSNQPLGKSASLVSLASNFLKWHQLGKEVEPALAIDGSNFPMWSAALKDLVGRVTQKADYFKTDFSTVDPPLSNGVLAIIRASVDVSLRASLNGMSAYGAYQSLHFQTIGSSASSKKRRTTVRAASEKGKP